MVFTFSTFFDSLHPPNHLSKWNRAR